MENCLSLQYEDFGDGRERFRRQEPVRTTENIRNGKARNCGVSFDENVSTEVVKIIQSYTGVVNKMV